MNALKIAMRRRQARVTENIDMSARDNAAVGFTVIRSLVIAIGLLAGTAGAQQFGGGVIDFCNNDPATGQPYYDNAAFNVANPLSATLKPPFYNYPQTFGSFTDLGHTTWTPTNTNTIENGPNEINMYQNLHTVSGANNDGAHPPNPSGVNPWGDSPNKPDKCALNFYGTSGLISNGHANMWITILAAPQAGKSVKQLDTLGLVPKTNSWNLTATVWFDNVSGAPNPHGNGGWNNGKLVGIIAGFDPQTSQGLMLGLSDAGITEFLELVQFDASVDYNGNIVNPTVIASKSLKVSSISSTGDGGSTFNSLAYVVTLNITMTSTQIQADASVYPAISIYDHSGNLYSCPDPPLGHPAPDQQCLHYLGPLPAGIPQSGAVGIAVLSPTSGAGVVDVYVSKFTFTPSSFAPD